MDILFKGSPREIKNSRSTIEELRSTFRHFVRRYISIQHKDDWELLEDSIIKTLSEHFDFWKNQFSELMTCAEDQVKVLRKDIELNTKDFNLLMDNVLIFEPRDRSDIKACDIAEKILRSKNQ